MNLIRHTKDGEKNKGPQIMLYFKPKTSRDSEQHTAFLKFKEDAIVAEIHDDVLYCLRCSNELNESY